eukprot:TRINITY_DN3731_c0_g2_i3.p1 TRINITY_DN3731_c0_g2~~TRINITY_DN3731_c0_g2_i3.p1  ORF type:complete len:172 (-),score=36.05 TRINITY_DN3731_c0_g2_i3:18-533(-)
MDGTTSNVAVFNSLVKPVVESFLSGVNDTVIMYGPTGSGKTYTMLGDEKTRRHLREIAEISSFDPLPKTPRKGEPGVLLYALDHIFKVLELAKKGTAIVKVSYIEIYNDNIYDLLQEKSMLSNCLPINETDSGKFVLKGVVEQPVKDLTEVIQSIRTVSYTHLTLPTICSV